MPPFARIKGLTAAEQDCQRESGTASPALVRAAASSGRNVGRGKELTPSEQHVSTKRFIRRLQLLDRVVAPTPAGVGPVSRGDLLKGSIEGVGVLEVTVV